MQLKINKACGFSSIYVLPQKYRKPTVVRSGSDSSLTLARGHTSSQLLSQQQKSLCMSVCVRKRSMVVHSGPESSTTSQHGPSSQFPQNSEDDILINEESRARSSFVVDDFVEPDNIAAILKESVILARVIVEQVFSGLTLRFLAPISIGDTIFVRSDLEGKVEEIAANCIAIRTKEGHLALIPNSLLLSQAMSKKLGINRRLFVRKFTIKVEDGEKVPKIMEAIKDMLRANPHVLLDKMEPLCCSQNEGPHAILTLECHLKNVGKTAWEGDIAEGDVFLQAVLIIHRNGGEILSA